MFKRLIWLTMDYPKATLVVTVLVTLVFGAQFPRMHIDTDPENESILSAGLRDLTLGGLLEGLIRLADPYFDLVVPPPWNLLLDIDLSGLKFLLSSKKGAGVRVENLHVKLPFLELHGFEVWLALPIELEPSVDHSGQRDGVASRGLGNRCWLALTALSNLPAEAYAAASVSRLSGSW